MPDPLRSHCVGIVRTLTSAGVPATEAQEVFDLAGHAAQQAIDVLFRILETGSSSRGKAMGIQLAVQLLRARLADASAKMDEFATEEGFGTVTYSSAEQPQ